MSAGVSVQHQHNTFPPQLDRTGATVARSVNPMPHFVQQYALPIHHPQQYRQNGNSSFEAGGLSTPHAETTLRRKTPNGTISAGFDVSVDESNPPHKHQLLNDKHTFIQHERLRNANNTTWLPPAASPWQGGPMQQQQPPSSFPVMDSMLNQSIGGHFTAQQYYGTVPSVVQPSFQYVGSTALGLQGSGPYGPYWHDGTFVPYRPAAIRDPRFYHHVAGNFYPGSLPSSQQAYQASLWQQPTPPWPPTQAHPSPGLAFPGLHPQSPATPTFVSGRVGPSIPGHDLRVNRASQLTPSASLNGTPFPLSGETEFGSASSSGQQRDQTFAWALQQYRDLLTFIHQTRQQQQQNRAFHGQLQTPQRPSFYPKPPKPTATGSSIRLPHRRTDSDSSKRKENEAPFEATSGGGRNTDGSGGPKLRVSSSVWSPSGVHFHDNEYLRRASHDQYQSASQRLGQPVTFPMGKMETLRRSSGSVVSSILPHMPHDDSPPSRAGTALLSITRMCQETDWKWTDGMHLGGCLAYGLGDYAKSLRWFKKVLEQDPRHLEATSNMAATMLALNQRQDAELNWMKVVKAAPNHFEAVEHLVGLLCSEGRSKDAIKVIEYVERALRQFKAGDASKITDRQSDCSSSTASRSPCASESTDKISYDFEADGDTFVVDWKESSVVMEPGFGSSGFAIPGRDNGRILALIHAKGNMLYGLGDNGGAAKAFEDAVLIATGRKFNGIQALVEHILIQVTSTVQIRRVNPKASSSEPFLLSPDQALQTAELCFPNEGGLSSLHYIPGGAQSLARKAVLSTTSNALLSLAKIFQDGMSNANRSAGVKPLAHGVRDILALYYLSLSLQPSPSTANNVGILLASVQQAGPLAVSQQRVDLPGVAPGSGIALALQYYNYGLQLDQHHAHLYTNLGSLLKDIGQLDAAINMYERAVKCDGKFDIALANLANAVKDKGRISDAIVYYRRAVEVSPEFAEAVCGLANALNSVCGWQGRGGISDGGGRRDRWHVDGNGMLVDAKKPGVTRTGWIKRVVEIVDKQLAEGEGWGSGTLSPKLIEDIILRVCVSEDNDREKGKLAKNLRQTLTGWSGKAWEGARVTRLIERATRRIGWQWYHDLHIHKKERSMDNYLRPQLPGALAVPTAPTVLPFHTFTCPMSAKQIRLISQRNGLRISVSTLRSPWLPRHVYQPPKPPAPYLRVGYVSSDFNNHPLAHLMQSVFGLHDQSRVRAYCYATTASDNSVHRQQIQAEAPEFHDASSWSAERLIDQIVQDGIHILVNLNGYTRGARNEVFAARPAPIQMSFMGFAGTLGAEWCDYLLADETAVPPSTLRPWRKNIDLEDHLADENSGGDNEEWVYGENIIYCRDTFFCCDHKQSAPDANDKGITWEDEQRRRWQMRKELFPQISDDTVIFGNFNQLYKIDPTTFRTWLRILSAVPNSILWLLRFPDLGETHLLATARSWAGQEVASRIIFTDVAPKHLHISRARLCDLVVDTAECNAHTTAADVLWSGTPLLTLPRYPYKMCSRMAASILRGALPKTAEGARAADELVASGEDDYENKAIALGNSLRYARGSGGAATGRLMELRKLLFEARWTSALFDTRRWVADLEDAYDEAWARWVDGRGGDIWLDKVPRGGRRKKKERET